MIQIPLAQAQFDQRAAELRAQGVAIEGKAGQIEQSGVKLAWTYNGAMLTVNVVKKPMLMPAALIEGKIRGWFSA